MSDYFYDDFDHVRPYQPAGIMMVFGEGTPSAVPLRNKLALRNCGFAAARSASAMPRGRYLPTPGRWALLALDLLASAAFLLSGRLFARSTAGLACSKRRRR